MNRHICGSQVVSKAVKCCRQCAAACPEGTPELDTDMTPQKRHVSDSSDSAQGREHRPVTLALVTEDAQTEVLAT